ncbi:hypothetical protein LUX01_08955 [Streptomyces sudanensis]|uniref:hypothetical protein n=1 Tax=Streptomyces sudanensis TaxID=436397 RepID=UPI0020CD769D|nr:hypothetical protein [Streptomyces sudanensis]MCP9986799.1 hypothetical protein [Streptomyces sudanensis]
MSQPVPPSGNPFADAPDADPAAPQPFPQEAPAPVRDNLVPGLLAALVAALVAAAAYGGIGGAIEREVGYAAIGVGLLVGFAAGKAGGRNPVLPFAAAVLAAGAVCLGQLVTIAMLLGEMGGHSFAEVFFQNFGDLTDLWRTAADAMTYVFLALGAVSGFGCAKKASA